MKNKNQTVLTTPKRSKMEKNVVSDSFNTNTDFIL